MEWIKVTDRTPLGKNFEVLIYFKNSVGWHVGTCVWDGSNFCDWCDECDHHSHYSHDTPVTHWMQLPCKPKQQP